MKRFLYLRILAITNLVAIIYCLVALIRMMLKYMHANSMNIVGLLIITLCAWPSVFILYIYTKYYPNKEMPKIVVIGYRISEALAWIGAALFLFAGIAIFSSNNRGDTNTYFGAFVFTLVALLTLAQLITGGRLLTTIRANARLILENSFN